jgi:hypothetical protein
MNVKFFSRADLVECARRAEEWGYNRKVGPDVGGLLDKSYPVLYWMPHYYRNGRPAEPHLRCVVWVPNRRNRPNDMVLDLARDTDLLVLLENRQKTLHLIVDVPREFFDRLLTKEVEWEAAGMGERK